MATFIEDLGIVSAYGEAVSKGYTGTEEEFAEMLANLPDKLAEAREYATSAAESSASAASSAAGVQRNASIASTAASDAQSAAASALQSATFAETTVEGIEEHEEQCRIYRAEAVAAAEELKTTTLWNDALIDETVTGKIASFSDGCVGMPMKSIVAEMTPVQSGIGDPSPSPTNIRPISGRTGLTVKRCGKNLIPNIKYQSSANAVYLGAATANYELYLPVGTYTLSVEYLNNAHSGAYYRLSSDSANRTIWSPSSTAATGTFTVDKDEPLNLWLYKSDGISANNIGSFQVEAGSTATDYTPYTGHTYPVSWQTEAGTIYGGTLNVTTGVLTVEYEKYTIPSDIAVTDRIDSQNRVYWNFTDMMPGAYLTDENTVCNRLPKSAPTNEPTAPCICIGAASNASYVYLQGVKLLEGVTNLATLRTWLEANPVEFTYKLATPQTYQLTPTEVRTILGENLVYSDADDVTVNYYVDMKGYIDKRLNTTRMMIAGVETSLVATKNYAIGDFVIVNDTLYRITAVITSGKTITPGTNASETTVAEQLIALYNA